MGTTLDSWACPVCGNSSLILTEYPSKRGFRLLCKGAESTEPHYLRIYIQDYRKGASFLPVLKAEPAAAEAPAEVPRNSRVKDLLARAARLAAA